MKKLSVIVVTFNEGLDVLKQCFDSVHDSRDVDFELIVVDNGANDATRGLLTSYKDAVYLRNEKNTGFAAAVNRGAKIARGELLLLLNPDTSFRPDALERMVEHMNNDREVGIASSVIRYPNGKLQESIRRFPGVWDQMLILLKAPHVFKSFRSVDRYMMRDKNLLKTQDVDSIMGAFMFIRQDLAHDIGLLDERYFIWFEEVDYCKMAVDAGWKIRHYADVEILHHKGHAFGKIATLRKQKWIRSSLRKYMQKHHGVLVWLLFWALTPLFTALGWLAAAVKPK